MTILGEGWSHQPCLNIDRHAAGNAPGLARHIPTRRIPRPSCEASIPEGPFGRPARPISTEVRDG